MLTGLRGVCFPAEMSPKLVLLLEKVMKTLKEREGLCLKVEKESKHVFRFKLRENS